MLASRLAAFSNIWQFFRSQKVVAAEYSIHFYNCLKILSKRNEVASWDKPVVVSANNKRQDDIGAALTSKLSQLVTIFLPTTDEHWEIIIPILSM